MDRLGLAETGVENPPWLKGHGGFSFLVHCSCTKGTERSLTTWYEVCSVWTLASPADCNPAATQGIGGSTPSRYTYRR